MAGASAFGAIFGGIAVGFVILCCFKQCLRSAPDHKGTELGAPTAVAMVATSEASSVKFVYFMRTAGQLIAQRFSSGTPSDGSLLPTRKETNSASPKWADGAASSPSKSQASVQMASCAAASNSSCAAASNSPATKGLEGKTACSGTGNASKNGKSVYAEPVCQTEPHPDDYIT